MSRYSLATSLLVGAAGPGAWQAIDLDGRVEPLRGPLPPAAGRFPDPEGRRRVPHGAIEAVGGPRRDRPANRPPAIPSPRERVPAAAIIPVRAAGVARPHPIREALPRIVLAPARRRAMPRRHKLMLALAAEVLLAGTARARQNFRPPAIEVEDLGRDDRKIAQLAPVDLGRGTGSTGERGASSAVRTITSGQRLPSPRGA